MRAVFVLSLAIIMLRAKAWSPVKNPFELMVPPIKIHPISDCMHVTSEDGDYIFKKIPHLVTTDTEKEMNMVDVGNPMTVCGLYVVGKPDQLVEITIKHLDVNCESGGLMAFVDGWELNGHYFPSIKDHHRSLNNRVQEFCNDHSHWPVMSYKKSFRSSQNAALLQYRIPIRGSFIANVHFRTMPEPCNIMVEDVSSYYTVRNYGRRGNCTLTALFPAVVSLISINVGGKIESEKVDYECDSMEDRLDVGGSGGLDSYDMERSTNICGHTKKPGPEQAIFCGVTSVRLMSSGKYHNEAVLLVRQADENDLELASLICPL